MTSDKKVFLRPISPEQYEAEFNANEIAHDLMNGDEMTNEDRYEAARAAGEPVNVTGRRGRRDTDVDALRAAVDIFERAPLPDDRLRRNILELRRPTGPRRDLKQVMEPVIDTVMATTFVSLAADSRCLTIVTQFALWVIHHNADGTFQPKRDLAERLIQDFVAAECRDKRSKSRATYVAMLRRCQRGEGRPNAISRQPSQPPYRPRQAKRLWQTADDLSHSDGAEVKTLLALTFGAGLLTPELVDVMVEDIEPTPGRTSVSVTVSRGQFVRTVPVFGAYATWLTERRRELRPDQLIFRLDYRSRRNAVSDLVRRIADTTPEFNNFKATRARNAWMTEALMSEIPFHAVCQAAGIGPGTHLPTDLLPNMPYLQPIDIRRAFENRYRHLSSPAD